MTDKMKDVFWKRGWGEVQHIWRVNDFNSKYAFSPCGQIMSAPLLNMMSDDDVRKCKKCKKAEARMAKEYNG